MEIKRLLEEIRARAPERYAAEWDHSGVQVAGERVDAAKLAVTLDPLPGVVEECLKWGADVVLTHHPLAMRPEWLDGEGPYMDVVRRMVKAGAWLYAAHTSLDCAPGGPAFWLGEALGLTDTAILESGRRFPCLEAGFLAGTPLDAATAAAWTERDGVHAVTQSASREVRVICTAEAWPQVARAAAATQQEPPVFYVREMREPAEEVGFGQVGRLPERMDWEAFTRLLDAALFAAQPARPWRVCGPRPETVRTVAYCGGSGASLTGAAHRAGADVLITGDMKYHQALEAPLAVIDVGHFLLEEEMMRRFAVDLSTALDGEAVDVRFFKGADPFGFHTPWGGGETG